MKLSAWAALLATLTLAPQAVAAPTLADGFVYLSDIAPDISQDMRYFGRRNFIGARVDGYEAARCILTRPAAEALAQVQAELKTAGFSLKVFDCYRPQPAVDHFLRWAADEKLTQTKAIYYPHVSKQQLIDEVYVAAKSGHSKGSTVDLGIIENGLADRRNPTDADDGCSRRAALRDGALDMGTGFDCFDPLAATASPSASAQQRANRLLLKSLMEKRGFRNYEREWWHYTLNNEPFPDRYFGFPVR